MWCARSSYDNRSRPGFEPVSRMMQRNLKIAERRPVLECRRYAIRIPQISSQRPACAGLTAWNVATSSTATGRTTKTTLRGCPSWILIEPCAWPRSFHSGVFWRKSGPGPKRGACGQLTARKLCAGIRPPRHRSLVSYIGDPDAPFLSTAGDGSNPSEGLEKCKEDLRFSISAMAVC